MALAKTDGIIEGISGKFGGQYFKKDSAGQHIVAMPRKVELQQKGSQLKQKKWYSGKKKEEHAGGPPVEQYELPKSPYSAIVYSLETIWAQRTPSLTPPYQAEVEKTGYWPDLIWQWVENNWDPSMTLWGMTKEVMFLMMLKWFHVAKFTWGFGNSVAYTSAIVNMQNFLSKSAAAVAVPALALWVGVMGLGLFFRIYEWLQGRSGSVSFNKGRVLLRKKDSIFWGGLVSRPSKKMYDFTECSPADFGSYTWRITPDRLQYQLHWLYLHGLWQTVDKRLLWWYIYTWKTIKCRYRGTAYAVGTGIYRLECDETQIEYWGKPVGWVGGLDYGCFYLQYLSDHFQYQGNPQPPL